ncbi:leucine-rich repeat domain-containing protein, partial [Listeria innocua]|uniref:leucine-rich repeat domain-containing protein n=1 Tax=Listeria innocua TaxID=1642 RepID=UPI0016271258
MRFSRKESEQKQKNWRMWKKGKQWLCGAALFFTVVSSPGMLVLADEVNSGDSTEVTAGEEVPPLPEGSNENEVEEATEEDGVSSPETATPSQQEENTSNTTENVGGGKKERPKQGRIITTPTAISDVFPDNAVAQTIRQILGATTVSDMITQSDLDSITSVTISYWGASNLSGMEHLTNLTNLFLNGNPTLSDISPLSGLTKLTTLRISDSNVSDISPLSGLTNLTSLDLRNNQISDISPLSGLTKLTTTLYLENNQISDVSPLSGLTKLQALNLNNNQISDISPLSGLSGLVGRLDLDGNQISDISPLSGIHFRALSIRNNQVSDVSSLNTSVWFLDAREQQFTLEKKWSNSLEIPFVIGELPWLWNSRGGGPINIDISDGGEAISSGAKWTSLPNASQNLTYSWANQRDTTVTNYSYYFSGTVTVRVIPVEVKILVDSDGDSQTTGDQTLLAEESD